jgi:hypothetical protein
MQAVAAVLESRAFLYRLTQHQLTPRVPGPVRMEARALLRHFPEANLLAPLLEPSQNETQD